MTSPISPEGTVGGDTPLTSELARKIHDRPLEYDMTDVWKLCRLLEKRTTTLPALKQRVEELEKMLADTEDALEWQAANEARFWGIEDVHGYAKAAKNLLIKVKQALTPKDKATE